ncbi:hypothetical protein TVAG_061030 [Trichomonas vaginalis G3]|uniref:Uncharacterized protein n=1 Tax=Trichomonas vaginalis (strain ATCC PRA-98 / G3) TaxID=412133 RepID=A2GW78_TRIV3|nr:hypothetical protein TVAGG3_0537810 [Trichomonas vaginalis G3]EAX78589.1 hypothetical protein TVAG_061030 [Trichomonas vaginalis G3]KAI5519614.1 hypothetical protein TVAGG3_0537810 [Trichomonas vaginalis G3]|eukprot:XP_001291519.1 hypothetical protein [Trichomonas vaginalis G3]
MSPSEVMKNGRPEKWNSALRICIIRGIGISLFGSCIHGRFAKNLRRASFFISFMSSTGVFSGICRTIPVSISIFSAPLPDNQKPRDLLALSLPKYCLTTSFISIR